MNNRGRGKQAAWRTASNSEKRIRRNYDFTEDNLKLIDEAFKGLSMAGQASTPSDAVNHLLAKAVKVHNHHLSEIVLTNQALRQLARFIVDDLATRDPEALDDGDILKAAERTIRRTE